MRGCWPTTATLPRRSAIVSWRVLHPVQKDCEASGKHRSRWTSGSNDLVFHCIRSQRINCLCIVSGIVVPRIPALPVPAILAVGVVAAPGTHAATLPSGGEVTALPGVGETLGI